jgi:DNA polymerase-3 subunit gamma/tau
MALYREKRPRTFNELIGQLHIVRTLTNQLTSGNISHAYLFCGTRGTGKTSTAKIFSRAVNCLQPANGEPCNECEVCRNILTERNLNVAEIDGASNNKVENVRNLLEEVKYPPTEGKYKVYIIDEAHMLTDSAFNAFLKTLEEPLPHVIFILATTDPQKIPATILSRCQRYDFKRIGMADMVTAIKGYIKDVQIEDEALRYIASLSDGAMRDALSILDQCISFYGGEIITLDKARNLLGAVDRQVLFDFTDSLAASDAGNALTLIDGIIREGRDISQFISDIIRHFRDLLVASQTGGLDLLEHIEETRQALKEQSERLSLQEIIGYIYIFSELQRDIRFAPHARTALEVCAVKICSPLLVKKKITEKADVIKTPPPVPIKQNQPVKTVAPVINETKATPITEKFSIKLEAIQAIVKDWKDFCKGFPLPLRTWLLPTKAEQENGKLQIICTNDAACALLKERKNEIQEKLAAHFSMETAPNLAFIVQETYNKPDIESEASNVIANEYDWAALDQQAMDDTIF